MWWSEVPCLALVGSVNRNVWNPLPKTTPPAVESCLVTYSLKKGGWGVAAGSRQAATGLPIPAL